MSVAPQGRPGSKVPIKPPVVVQTKAPPRGGGPTVAKSPTSPRDKRPITPKSSTPLKNYSYRPEREPVSVVSSRGAPSPQQHLPVRQGSYPPQETREELTFWSPPPESHSMGRSTFDWHDKAPEDRIHVPEEVHPFGRYDCVVRGSFIIEGLNYAKFQAPMSKDNVEHRKKFTTALRDDIIACVGQGVRRKDIMLRAAPGPIRGVVLEYDKYKEDLPTLVDADWGIEFEYAIRSRNEVSQQHVGMMLFTSLREPGGLDVDDARQAWLRYIDPTVPPNNIYTSPVPTAH
eukprot:TRINITY_DN2078_c2_g2_i1.p1 TRINITY_DN2078_c2_g2~~TRINITY_DN2078_c2_g2_i1.p1  ORF type:complete len:308 (+),score=53.21 TRINITY_DN2078_c2_g2_i1:62-925(+)